MNYHHPRHGETEENRIREGDQFFDHHRDGVIVTVLGVSRDWRHRTVLIEVPGVTRREDTGLTESGFAEAGRFERFVVEAEA